MKLTVLIDNNTLIDRYFIGEPGVSYLIREGDKQTIFDVGYSDAFIINAKKMKLDLLQTDFIVFSHGHMDHTWGLDPLLKMYTEAKIEAVPFKKPTLVAHPSVFLTKSIDGLNEIGCTISERKLQQHVELKLSKEPVWLTDKLVFLGEIERLIEFEKMKPVGKIHRTTGMEDDFVVDDTALAYKGDHGLVIITGCSHSGICNIIEYAKKVGGEERVSEVIGGFHLMQPSQQQLKGTTEYFKKLGAKEVHACHCVDLGSKIALAKVANLKEVGVGLSLNYE
jgi:7,8-dihydropterin-6-yl-methyl-4-(beta-D-ribofuranosyl)aminobenzene 5'-phosphate synthase